mgnify:CR=1 FL=1
MLGELEERVSKISPHSIPIRLRKLIGLATYMSNADMARALSEHRIQVLVRVGGSEQEHDLQDGLATVVFPDEDLVFLDGKLLDSSKPLPRATIAAHKPSFMPKKLN